MELPSAEMGKVWARDHLTVIKKKKKPTKTLYLEYFRSLPPNLNHLNMAIKILINMMSSYLNKVFLLKV